MPLNDIYYQEKAGQHAVVFVSTEIPVSVFSNHRIFETEEMARDCANYLKPLLNRVDPLTAMTLFMMYHDGIVCPQGRPAST